MTEQLKQAAQQALACMRGLQQHLGPDSCATEADALERALTTSQPAQAGEVDERVAFEAMAEKFEAMHANGDVWISTIAASKLCRASLPTQPAAQATPEPGEWHLLNPAGKVVAVEKTAVKALARIDGYKPTVEGLLGYEEAGWRIQPATPPQQAAGEPVARVELMQAGGNAGLATRIVEIDDPLRERLRPGDLLYTHPAPGVPEEGK